MSGLFDLCLQTIIRATLLNLFLMEEGAYCMHTQEPLDLESMKTKKCVTDPEVAGQKDTAKPAKVCLLPTRQKPELVRMEGKPPKENPGSEVQGRCREFKDKTQESLGQRKARETEKSQSM